MHRISVYGFFPFSMRWSCLKGHLRTFLKDREVDLSILVIALGEGDSFECAGWKEWIHTCSKLIYWAKMVGYVGYMWTCIGVMVIKR